MKVLHLMGARQGGLAIDLQSYDVAINHEHCSFNDKTADLLFFVLLILEVRSNVWP
jgi:hypothetical protein